MVDSTRSAAELVLIQEGEFTMGSDRHYPEEAPTQRVWIDGFSMSATAVTNREFAAFVEATGYQSVAERPLDPADFPGAPAENLLPGSLVFTMTSGPVDLRNLSQWWVWTPGACWNMPGGPGTEVESLLDHPVVHVAHEDAEAYATWLGLRLPTEAEWEYASRGGLDDKAFVWGDEAVPDGRYLANFWQGDFPWRNTADDGFAGTAPVGSFAPNGYGLYDMAGNVWEWTDDWYGERVRGVSPDGMLSNPSGASVKDSFDSAQAQFPIPRKVVKGGSFLCADNYCQRYRPAARRPQMIDTGMSHVGFRTVSDNAPA
ncbi:MAG: formylglycine-generating enzyme family protein [Acidimicrobiales bacterium]